MCVCEADRGTAKLRGGGGGGGAKTRTARLGADYVPFSFKGKGGQHARREVLLVLLVDTKSI